MRLATLVVCLMIGAGLSPAAPEKDKDACPSNGRQAGRGINFYSRARELALGRDLAMDLERSVRLIDDPVVSEYINRIGRNLALNSNSQFVPRIRIIRSEDTNSVTIPGGFIYINSGLIRAAHNEAELAAALAHEIGHVAARHYTRQASLTDLLGYSAIPLMFVGGLPGLMLQEGASLGAPLVWKKFSRSAEGEADRLGIQYAYDAGYDPTAFVDLLERISLQQLGKRNLIDKMMAEHPEIDSRIRAAQKQIQNRLTPREQYLLQTSEFDQVKQRLITIESNGNVPRRPTYSPTPPDERPRIRRPD